ncbi:MAG: DUF2520 domain-containing protein [bacterium]|nr:DUF2520 domain-containing protein [bacterium]
MMAKNSQPTTRSLPHLLPDCGNAKQNTLHPVGEQGSVDASRGCFSIIGAGNLGTSLICSLVRKGYMLKYIYQKSKFDGFADFLEHDIGKIVKESDIIFICTQESKIREIAQYIATTTNPGGKLFYHTSNSLTSTELEAIEAKGGLVASFSPLQTFPPYDAGDVQNNLFEGISFLAEGNNAALEPARQIAADLNARVLLVDKETKIYFHISAVCACNFLISILKLSESQLKKAGKIEIHDGGSKNQGTGARGSEDQKTVADAPK